MNWTQWSLVLRFMIWMLALHLEIKKDEIFTSGQELLAEMRSAADRVQG